MIAKAPKRNDEVWYASLLRENQFYKYVLAVLFLVILVLAGTAFLLFNKKQPIYVFDSSTGRTYATQRITGAMWDNLLIAASRDFISDFLSYDHLYIERARARAYGRMTPVAQKKYKETFANPQLLMNVVKAHKTSSVRFIQEPRVILRAGQEFRTFLMVEVTVNNPDGTQSTQASNWKISWLALGSTPDRPDGLWVSDLEPVGTKELNDILNQIQ
ncbi:MAG TPA: VirB8/TrbF family protein [Fibrobacteria bacterium]|nr:VirB8/TrbF family protein [Fibrobacteria bacterium]